MTLMRLVAHDLPQPPVAVPSQTGRTTELSQPGRPALLSAQRAGRGARAGVTSGPGRMPPIRVL